MSALSDASAKLQVIADTYGYDAQSRQLIEEMSELTQAINKFWRKEMKCGNLLSPEMIYGKFPYSVSERLENIAEEIADVKICLEQVEYLLQCDWLVDKYVNEKIDRQLERMERKQQ